MIYSHVSGGEEAMDIFVGATTPVYETFGTLQAASSEIERLTGLYQHMFKNHYAQVMERSSPSPSK